MELNKRQKFLVGLIGISTATIVVAVGTIWYILSLPTTRPKEDFPVQILGEQIKAKDEQVVTKDIKTENNVHTFESNGVKYTVKIEMDGLMAKVNVNADSHDKAVKVTHNFISGKLVAKKGEGLKEIYVSEDFAIEHKEIKEKLFKGSFNRDVSVTIKDDKATLAGLQIVDLHGQVWNIKLGA